MKERNKDKIYIIINSNDEFDSLLDNMNVPFIESFVGKLKALITRILYKREYVELQIHNCIAGTHRSCQYIENALTNKLGRSAKLQFQVDVAKPKGCDHIIIRAGFWLPPKCFVQQIELSLQYANFVDIPKSKFPESYLQQPFVLANRLKIRGCPVTVMQFPGFIRITRRLPLKESKRKTQAPFIW